MLAEVVSAGLSVVGAAAVEFVEGGAVGGGVVEAGAELAVGSDEVDRGAAVDVVAVDCDAGFTPPAESLPHATSVNEIVQITAARHAFVRPCILRAFILRPFILWASIGRAFIVAI